MNKESPDEELRDESQILGELHARKILTRLRLEEAASSKGFSIKEIFFPVFGLFGLVAFTLRYEVDLMIVLPSSLIGIYMHIDSKNKEIHKRMDAILKLQELEVKELQEKSGEV